METVLEQRQKLLGVLREFGVADTDITDNELDGLWREGYRSRRSLELASREELVEAGLPRGIVNFIYPPQRQQRDLSKDFAKALVQPSLEAPPALDNLQQFLAEPPATKIPISTQALAFLQLDEDIKKCFIGDTGWLAYTVGTSLVADLQFGGSEVFTSHAEATVIISVLRHLDALLPPELYLGIVVERDMKDSTSLMTLQSQGGMSLRPDGVLRDIDGVRMLAKWEDKAASMEKALEDLHKKTAVWTPLYYGDIEYLPCFIAAGSQLQFYAISRAAGGVQWPRAVSARLDLTRQDHRARAVITAIKFFQLLRAQRARYPKYVLAAGREMRAPHPSGFTRSIFFRTDELAVRKRVYPWSIYAEWSGVSFKDLQALYVATGGCRWVVHAASRQQPTLKEDKYCVDLIPVGLQSNNALPTTEEEARHMFHGLLHGLAAIHEAGFVHRDLRWDNFACSPTDRHWFLIDLEMSTRADQQPKEGFQLAGWQPGVMLVNGRYTRASDLYQLGLTFGKCAHLLESDAGRAFLDAILTQPADQRLSARELLQHEWLRCEGPKCGVAGAQPRER